MRISTADGFYSISPMPGQPNVAICYDFTVFPAARGKGYGHRLKKHQMENLLQQGYSLAICTVQSSNKKQIKILEAAGWTQARSFLDFRTNQVATTYFWDVC